mgnify:FL=1
MGGVIFLVKKIIDENDLNSLKKILTLIDSDHSVFSESWEHLNQYEATKKRQEQELSQKKVLEKRK